MLRACVRNLFAPKKHAPLRKHPTRLKLGIESLETRDLMAAGLTAALRYVTSHLNVTGGIQKRTRSESGVDDTN